VTISRYHADDERANENSVMEEQRGRHVACAMRCEKWSMIRGCDRAVRATLLPQCQCYEMRARVYVCVCVRARARACTIRVSREEQSEYAIKREEEEGRKRRDSRDIT
jgi:hypothetical protein